MSNPDEEICFCSHVTRRKLVNFIRAKKPAKLEGLADCLGAGTTCGLCRGRLRQIFEETKAAMAAEKKTGS